MIITITNISYFIHDERNCFNHNFMFTICFKCDIPLSSFILYDSLYTNNILCHATENTKPAVSSEENCRWIFISDFSFICGGILFAFHAKKRINESQREQWTHCGLCITIFHDLFSTFAALIAFCFRSVEIYVCGERNEKKQMNKTKRKSPTEYLLLSVSSVLVIDFCFRKSTPSTPSTPSTWK